MYLIEVVSSHWSVRRVPLVVAANTPAANMKWKVYLNLDSASGKALPRSRLQTTPIFAWLVLLCIMAS